MTSYTVTGSTTNNTFGGLYLQVQVLNNAALAGTPATATSGTAYNCSITTTQAGSFVFGALNQNASETTFVASSGCTIISQYDNTADQNQYGSFRTTSGTGSPGATTVGSSTTFATNYGCCALEVLASGGTLSVDGSSPAAADSNTGSSITTASFTPPGNTLLVAILATDGDTSGNVQVATVSSSPVLTWTERVHLSSTVGAVNAYVGVWTASVPAAVTVLPPSWAQRVAVVPFRADVIM